MAAAAPQSSQTTASPSIGEQFGALLHPMLAAMEGSWLFAVVTGTSQRYALMHAPMPMFRRSANAKPTAAQSGFSRQGFGGPLRPGMMHPMHLEMFANPSRSMRDPLAARGSKIGLKGAGAVGGLRVGGRTFAMTSQATLAPSTTGLSKWWSFEGGKIPGLGQWFLNVANGNAVVSREDFDIHERGIDLAFVRVYNSQSQHDHLGSDGSLPSAYGDRWTNNYDAHLAFNATSDVMSVYAEDGSRYDYTAVAGGNFSPPPGLQGTSIAWDGGCGYYWNRKNGERWYFYSPAPVSQYCPGTVDPVAYYGRLFQIQGRNRTNAVTLTYGWSGDMSNPNQLTTMLVKHSDGQSLTFSFSAVNIGGVTYPELASVTLPTGLTLGYAAPQGNLVAVDGLGNNANSELPDMYTYYPGTHMLSAAAGPRFTLSWSACGDSVSCVTDGSEVTFAYTGTNLTQVQDYGIVNYTPTDGTGQLLQPSMPTGLQYWYTEQFANIGSGTTSIMDSDGHGSAWTYDSLGRLTTRQEWSNPSNALVTTETWDSNNDIVAATDPRGYETDYAYDTNGNTIEVGEPSQSVSVNGTPTTMRPTQLFSYDQYNNVLAYCDQVKTHSLGLDWNGAASTSDSLCPVGTGATGAAQFVYDYADANEPYGVLNNTYKPLGYEETYGYANGPVFDNYGLPTTITGTCMTQTIDTTTPSRCPLKTASYDSYGDVITYNEGKGAWGV